MQFAYNYPQAGR